MDTKATAIDGQIQGQFGKMPVGFYVSYATAPGVSAAAIASGTLANTYNGGTETRRSVNLAAELGVLPEKATLGFGIRRGKSGVNVVDALGATIAGTNATDNAWLLEGSYKLAQNMMLNLVYTKQSGTFWNTNAITATGSKQTTVNLATIF